MTEFPDKLRLKELAEEDIYFAKRDRELIQALREKRLAESAHCPSRKGKKRARSFEKQFQKITDKHQDKRRKRFKAYRRLIDKIVKVCSRQKKES